MKPYPTNFRAFLNHTKQYYKRFLTPKRLSAISLAAVSVGTVAVGINTVTAHAGVARWMLEDAFDEDIFFGKYDYIYNEDAPEESENRFHLQMPMMLEGYLEPENYVSGDDAATKPKLDTMIESAVNPGAFNIDRFELPDQEELDEASEDAMEFVENRPPKSPLE